MTSWQQAFNYISNPQVPRYCKDIAGLIQEFIEELIPRENNGCSDRTQKRPQRVLTWNLAQCRNFMAAPPQN